jgi:DNA-binding protein YbaB
VGALADMYERIVVTARSPDRSVTLTMTGRGGLSVELADDVRERHTEESLERQLNAALRVAVAAFQQAHAKAYEKVSAGSGESS